MRIKEKSENAKPAYPKEASLNPGTLYRLTHDQRCNDLYLRLSGMKSVNLHGNHCFELSETGYAQGRTCIPLPKDAEITLIQD